MLSLLDLEQTNFKIKKNQNIRSLKSERNKLQQISQHVATEISERNKIKIKTKEYLPDTTSDEHMN